MAWCDGIVDGKLTVVGGTVSLGSSHGTLSLVELGGGNHLHRLLGLDQSSNMKRC